MTTLYLAFNAVVYAVFALWCTLRLDSTSRNLGYTTLSNSGHSEYFTVYGGLQWGLALIFAMFAAKPEWRSAGVLAAIALYAPIVLHGMISLLRFGPVEPMTRAVAALEVAMLLVAVALWWFKQRMEA